MKRLAFSQTLSVCVALALLPPGMSAAATPLSANRFSSAPGEDLRTVSFELVYGMVLVQAIIDDEPGTFILDTGSPMLILNEEVIEGTSVQANTLQGGLAGDWKTCDISWAGVHKFNVNALAMDISHLEAVAGQPLKGLIGYDFFEAFDLVLDFENKELTLAPPGFVGEKNSWVLKANLPFVLEGHLPVIEAKIGDATFRFGLDTGAGANLCNIRRKHEIDPELLTPVRNADVVGLGGAQEFQVANVLETSIAGVNYWDMRFIFTDISNLNNLRENGVDGLLGFPFFDGGRFSINYKEQVISIWE